MEREFRGVFTALFPVVKAAAADPTTCTLQRRKSKPARRAEDYPTVFALRWREGADRGGDAGRTFVPIHRRSTSWTRVEAALDDVVTCSACSNSCEQSGIIIALTDDGDADALAA